jgi:hypothetical protein
MLTEKKVFGSDINGGYNLYIQELVSYRALKKRRTITNQLLALLGSKKFTKRRFSKNVFEKIIINRIGKYILHFSFINLVYTKLKLLFQNIPNLLLKSKCLKPNYFLYLCTFIQHLRYRLFSRKKLKKKLFKIRFRSKRQFVDLYDTFLFYLISLKNKFNSYKLNNRFRVGSLKFRKNLNLKNSSLLKTALYNRYTFFNNIKSKRVIRFLAKIAFVFKRTKRSIYYKLLKPFRFPFRIGTKTTNFYLKHRPNRKIISYNDYRSLKIFFGGLKPQVFWKGSRSAVTKDTVGWSFLKKYSYLDFRLDYLISRIGFVENIFEGKNLIDNRRIIINGNIVQTNNVMIRPYDWIEIIDEERINFKLNYLSKMVVQRTQSYNLKSFPNFIEVNWSLFRFFILPLITLNDIVRPYKTFNYHIGGGKKQPAKLS